MGCTSSKDALFKLEPEMASWYKYFKAIELQDGDIHGFRNLQQKIKASGNVDDGDELPIRVLLDYFDPDFCKMTIMYKIFSTFRPGDPNGNICDLREFVFALWNFCTANENSLASFIFLIYKSTSESVIPKDLVTITRELYGTTHKDNENAQKIIADINENNTYFDAKGFVVYFKNQADFIPKLITVQNIMQEKAFGINFWKKMIQSRTTLTEDKLMGVYSEINSRMDWGLSPESMKKSSLLRRLSEKFVTKADGNISDSRHQHINQHPHNKKKPTKDSTGKAEMSSRRNFAAPKVAANANDGIEVKSITSSPNASEISSSPLRHVPAISISSHIAGATTSAIPGYISPITNNINRTLSPAPSVTSLPITTTTTTTTTTSHSPFVPLLSSLSSSSSSTTAPSTSMPQRRLSGEDFKMRRASEEAETALHMRLATADQLIAQVRKGSAEVMPPRRGGSGNGSGSGDNLPFKPRRPSIEVQDPPPRRRSSLDGLPPLTHKLSDGFLVPSMSRNSSPLPIPLTSTSTTTDAQMALSKDMNYNEFHNNNNSIPLPNMYDSVSHLMGDPRLVLKSEHINMDGNKLTHLRHGSVEPHRIIDAVIEEREEEREEDTQEFRYQTSLIRMNSSEIFT